MDNNDEIKKRELEQKKSHYLIKDNLPNFYNCNDVINLLNFSPFDFNDATSQLKTLDELVEKDKQREKDGFHRRIQIGKIAKPLPGNKTQVVVVPSTTEPKFYHDDSISDDDETTGGSGEGEEGEVIGRQKVQPHEGEGEGQGAGQGEGGDHDITSDAEQLGKILTEQFNLPNLKVKGKKRSLTKYTYSLTDMNREFGQLLDKKESLRKILKTNILLGNINPNEPIDTSTFIINPKDKMYRIMSREKDFEAQAVVFFIRDYSGSMEGAPTEVVVTQHLLIYSWLMYQYQSNVMTRFIVHDTDAKEVPDFYSYYRYQVAGGTYVYPAFDLLNKIIETEQLAKDYNIYVFYGTDGDDWENNGEKMLIALRIALSNINRCGITIAKNSYTTTKTTVEQYIENSGLLKEKHDLLRLEALDSAKATEDEIVETIRKLISD